MDRVYRLLQGLQPEFESLKSQLCNWENPISFNDRVSQLIGKESHLQDIKGSGEGAAYVTMNLGGTSSTQQGQSTATTGGPKKAQVKTKDNLWCNYCKKRWHTKETSWKQHGQPPQVHMVNSPYSLQDGQLENKRDGQR